LSASHSNNRKITEGARYDAGQGRRANRKNLESIGLPLLPLEVQAIY